MDSVRDAHVQVNISIVEMRITFLFLDDCSDSNKCECQQLTRDSINRMNDSLRPAGRGYKYRRLVPTQTIMCGIFECNSKCSCSKQRCYNRVVQQPMHIPIQVFAIYMLQLLFFVVI